MHSLQIGKLCTRDTLAPTVVRFSVYFLLYIVARDQTGVSALCDVSPWLEDASAGVALVDVSPWLEDASAGVALADVSGIIVVVVVVAVEKSGGGGGNDCAVVVVNNAGRGLKMVGKTEGLFCVM